MKKALIRFSTTRDLSSVFAQRLVSTPTPVPWYVRRSRFRVRRSGFSSEHGEKPAQLTNSGQSGTSFFTLLSTWRRGVETIQHASHLRIAVANSRPPDFYCPLPVQDTSLCVAFNLGLHGLCLTFVNGSLKPRRYRRLRASALSVRVLYQSRNSGKCLDPLVSNFSPHPHAPFQPATTQNCWYPLFPRRTCVMRLMRSGPNTPSLRLRGPLTHTHV